MYAWYYNSTICYAYLVDVPPGDDPFSEQSAFKASRWFTRGWTLQELIAPRKVVFFNGNWKVLGAKHSTKSMNYLGEEQKVLRKWGELLEKTTGVPEACLVQHKRPSLYSVAQRMCWASKRQCTRVEDIAYCLMGIFDISMPLLYGEGAKAFVRLQEEIMKEIDDHSLYAWTVPEGSCQSWMVSSIFARSPADFARSHNIIPVHEELGDLSVVTRKGLQMSLCLRPVNFLEASHLHRKHRTCETFHAVLNCAEEGDKTRRIALQIIRDVSVGSDRLSRSFYRCAKAEHLVAADDDKLRDPAAFQTIYIRKNVPQEIAQVFSSEYSFRPLGSSGYDYSSIDALTGVHNLASVLQGRGEYKEAEALFRQTRERREKELGIGHPDTLASVHSLASVLLDQGKYEEVEALHRQVLEGVEKVLGKDHPDTLRGVINLLLVLRLQEKHEEAIAEALKRQLDNPETLTRVSNLASELRDQGKYKDAEALHQQALEGRLKVLGTYDPDTLTSAHNLASVLQDQDKYEEAESLHRQALEGRKKVLGRDHPDTITSAHNLASVLQDQGKYEEAESLIDKH
jgi:tetratricopeptide (TPR) repeat protein